jgi:hypothetical protein
MRNVAALVFATSAGCLLAPPRPTDNASPDAGEDAAGDGGSDHEATPSSTAQLDLVAAIEISSTAPDSMLVRAGADRGGARAYLYLPRADVDPLRAQADCVLDLTPPGFAEARVVAIGPAAPEAFVLLVAEAQTARVAIYQVATSCPRELALTLPPIITEFPGGTTANAGSAFVGAFREDAIAQIWFGGPRLATIDVTTPGAPGMTKTPNVQGDSPVMDDFLLAVPNSLDVDGWPVDLVGAKATYRAALERANVVDVDPTVARDGADCMVTQPASACEPQVARAVLGGAAATEFHHLVFRPVLGAVDLLRDGRENYVRRMAMPPVVDGAIDSSIETDLDLVTLEVASNRTLAVYRNVLSIAPPSRLEVSVGDAVMRVVVGRFVSNAPRMILGLGPRPAATDVCVLFPPDESDSVTACGDL